MRPANTIIRSLLVPALAALVLPATGGAASRPAFGLGPLASEGVRSACYMIPSGTMAAKEFAFLEADGLFHLFYMMHETTLPMDSTEFEIGHAVSADLFSWTQLAPSVAARAECWDSHHIWSPHVVKQDSTYYMYYTGIAHVPYPWNLYQKIGVATSTDLVTWARYDSAAFSAASVPWTIADSSQFDGCQFRDPYLIPDPTQPGKWLMYYVTVPAEARGQLIVGVARGDGGLSPWTDVGPMWATDRAHYWGWCESPLVFEHGGLWYLFVNTDSGHPVRFRTAASPLADSTEWSGHYSLFDMMGQNPISDVYFGAELVSVPGHDYMALVNSMTNGIDIFEIEWGVPPYFSLVNPVTAAAAPSRPAALRLSTIGRTAAAGNVLFRMSLPESGPGGLEIFDVAGRRARVLRSGTLAAGETLAEWDGRDDAGARVPRGVYFARLAAGAAASVVRVPRSD